jgi:LDH2 family malate/lactate/ureidoglycolate dehydrogenase
MAFTNASPIVIPTRAKNPTLGTNPLSLAAPANEGDSFVLDMAASVVAIGKIEIAERKGDPIPEGWAVDKNGKSIEKSSDIHGFLPLGGYESSSYFKFSLY